jgi:TonB family protein
MTLALSLALHGAVYAYVSTRPDEPPVAPKQTSGELVYVEVEPTPPPPPLPDPTPTPAARVEPARPRAAVPRPTPVAPLPAPAEPSVVSDVPRDLPRRDLELSPAMLPSGSFALSLSIDAGLADDGTRPLHGLDRATDLVSATAKETIGRGRVDRGLVHPYYAQLGKALIKNWDADRVAGSGLKGLVEQTGENFKVANEIWLDHAAAFGRGGSPIDQAALAPNRRAPVTNNIQGLQGVDLDARKEMQREMSKQFKATRRAIIRVVQDATGKLLKVELVEPSNDQNVDREALKDVRAAAEKLPPPPPEAIEGHDRLSSLWSFELIISISPPIPTITFEFDEALGFIDARLPLDRRIYKKVRLVSVE